MRDRLMSMAIRVTTPAPREPLRWRQFGLVWLVSTALTVVLVAWGLWFAPSIIGLALGQGFAPARRSIAAGALAGLLGWALPLGWEHLRYGLAPAAQSLAAIMGVPHHTEVPVILTCLVGLLLGLTGAWLGAAARILLRAG